MTPKTLNGRGWLRPAAVITLLVAGGLVGAGFSSWDNGEPDRIPIVVAAAAQRSDSLPAGTGFAPVLKPALPAVVNITSARVVKTEVDPFLSDPFFQRFFGGQVPQPPPEQRQRGAGSGVIASAQGYIITNSHVVDGASSIRVFLQDRREFKGTVVGTDPKTDIAVVKIPANALPTLAMGDSSKIQVGDYVLAIGDPYGIGQTATMGIVSATGRGNLDIEDYEDFIQTDAAINPGNSGGALINARGELIGINTAILAVGGGGGNQGIGFAVPINMARFVMEEILKHGKVVRGYMGVVVQEVTPELAKVFKAEPWKGAVLGDVTPNGPAAKAGLQKGDVVVELNAEPVSGPNDLKLKIARLKPGSQVRLKVLRDGQPRAVTVTLEELTEKPAQRSADESGADNPLRGVQVDELSPAIAQQLRLRPGAKGVVVADVAVGTPAAEAGLRRGDVIEEINRQPVTSVSEFNRLVRQAGKESLVLLVNRQGTSAYVVVEPETR